MWLPLFNKTISDILNIAFLKLVTQKIHIFNLIFFSTLNDIIDGKSDLICQFKKTHLPKIWEEAPVMWKW